MEARQVIWRLGITVAAEVWDREQLKQSPKGGLLLDYHDGRVGGATSALLAFLDIRLGDFKDKVRRLYDRHKAEDVTRFATEVANWAVEEFDATTAKAEAL